MAADLSNQKKVVASDDESNRSEAEAHLRYPTPGELRDAGGQPTKSGKRYKTLPHVRAVSEYLNQYGVQSRRSQWRIAEHADGSFELWRFPRTSHIEHAIETADSSLAGLHDMIWQVVNERELVSDQEREIRNALDDLRSFADNVFKSIQGMEWAV